VSLAEVGTVASGENWPEAAYRADAAQVEPQLAQPRVRLQITFLSTVISDRMWHPLQNTLHLKSHDQ